MATQETRRNDAGSLLQTQIDTLQISVKKLKDEKNALLVSYSFWNLHSNFVLMIQKKLLSTIYLSGGTVNDYSEGGPRCHRLGEDEGETRGSADSLR